MAPSSTLLTDAGHDVGTWHEPLGTGCWRGEWIRMNGATVKIKVKNSFPSEDLLLQMKMKICVLDFLPYFFALFPFRPFLEAFLRIFLIGC